MAITKISFLAHYKVREIQEVLIPEMWGITTVPKVVITEYEKEAVFVLGQGPCGKTVDRLDVVYQEHDIVILQYHDDGTLKEFAYQRKDVLGRLTIERGLFGV
nr:MAG: hypothetical protein [Bacteriophage sp.]